MGARTPLSESGYNRGVELFLYYLGGCRVSGQNRPSGLTSGSALQQNRPVVDDSKGIAASPKNLARGCGNCFVGRPGLCGWQTDEVPPGKSGLAFSDSD